MLFLSVFFFFFFVNNYHFPVHWTFLPVNFQLRILSHIFLRCQLIQFANTTSNDFLFIFIAVIKWHSIRILSFTYNTFMIFFTLPIILTCERCIRHFYFSILRLMLLLTSLTNINSVFYAISWIIYYLAEISNSSSSSLMIQRLNYSWFDLRIPLSIDPCIHTFIIYHRSFIKETDSPNFLLSIPTIYWITENFYYDQRNNR